MPGFGEINFLDKLVGHIFDFESFDILLYIQVLFQKWS